MRFGFAWGLALAVIYGCQSSVAPSATPAPEQKKDVHRSLPVDMVVAIDDSGSISATEQALVRETSMLLADLADQGDRVSAVAFGVGAHRVASVLIQKDEDRRVFREAVRTRFTFREPRSDIRAGLKLIADPAQGLFRPVGESLRVLVVMSDGKLEPGEGDVTSALEEMKTLLRDRLKDVEVYAVTLGDQTSQQPIPGLQTPHNGAQLMREIVARLDDRYFHAKRIDQLLDAVGLVLGRAKGLSDLGAHSTQFRIDRTVDQLLLVVRKRSTAGGTDLCRSSDIRLMAPGEADPVTFARPTTGAAASMYWSSEYAFFDLIQVRKPREGNWAVGLSNGKTPEVLSRIVSPIEMRVSAQPVYFANESAELYAWLYDRNQKGVSDRGRLPLYRVRAQLPRGDALGGEGPLVSMSFDSSRGRYALPLPAALGARPGRTTIAVVAERRQSEGSDIMDPWFIRRSPPITITVEEPIIEWQTLAPVITHISGLAWFHKKLTFGAARRALGPAAHVPHFETPPDLELELARLDEKSGAYQLLAREKVAAGSDQNYTFGTPLTEPGKYRYRYRLSGATSEGPFRIESPWYPVEVRTGWVWVIAALALLLALCEFLLRVTPRLKGTITVADPPQTEDLNGRARFDSSAEFPELFDPNNTHFVLRPQRRFLRYATVLLVSKGEVTVTSDIDPDDNWTLSGGARKLPRNGCTLTIQDTIIQLAPKA